MQINEPMEYSVSLKTLIIIPVTQKNLKICDF